MFPVSPTTFCRHFIIYSTIYITILVLSQFLDLPVAVIQQVYVHLEINCEEMDRLCRRSYYGASKTTATFLTAKLKNVLRYIHLLQNSNNMALATL